MTPEQMARRLDRLRWRYHNQPAYRERVLEQQRTYRQTDAGKAAVKARKQRWRELHPLQARVKRSQYHHAEKYGITPEDYAALLVHQGGVCGLCLKPETHRDTRGRTRKLSIDHDHKTGRVRGLLCSRCNTALGLFDENVEVIQMAVSYLRLSEWYRDRAPFVIGESIPLPVTEAVA